MIVLGGLVLIAALVVWAIKAKRDGKSVLKIVLIIVVGVIAILVGFWSILIWGFSNFG